MRKVLLNRKWVLGLAIWTFICSVPGDIWAMPSQSMTAVSTNAVREAQVAQIMNVLSRPEARAAFLARGISEEKLRESLSGLSDSELDAVSQRADTIRAGGDAGGIILTVLLIILLAVVIMKVMEKRV